MRSIGHSGWTRHVLFSAALSSLLVGLVSPLPAYGSNVTLAWDPSSDPSVTGYKLYYGTACRCYSNSVAAGAATSATASGLGDGTTYYFAVTACDATGAESDYSAEVSYTVPVVTPQPTINAIGNVTITENAGMQTIALSGISAGQTTNSETLTLTATSSNPGLIPNPAVVYTSPNATGSLTFTPAASGIGTATVTVTVISSQSPTSTASTCFNVTVNPPVPGQVPLTNLFVLPNVGFSLPLNPTYANAGGFTFTLAPGAPAGASIVTRKGTPCLVWIPTAAQAATTNLLNIQLTYASAPALNTNETLLVVVLDCVDVSSSWTSVQAGQNCSIPFNLSASDGITNLLVTIGWLPDRFANPCFTLATLQNVSASLQNQITNLVIHLQTSAGQVLQGSNLLGQLSFQTSPSQSSAFVYMPLAVLGATKPNGTSYANPAEDMERVVVVGPTPLMERNSSSGTNMGLSLYGKVGARYQLQGQSALGSRPAWQSLLNYNQTNVQQTVTVDTAQPMGFYRLLQQ